MRERKDISIHAPREGRDGHAQTADTCRQAISIHAPREGRDLPVIPNKTVWNKISIHAPREGRDFVQTVLFLMTFFNFNPRAPRGARPVTTHSKVEALLISIHAPREGRDLRIGRPCQTV